MANLSSKIQGVSQAAMPVITAPISWTPTGSLTTNVTYSGKKWREGARGFYEVEIAFSGANTQGNVSLNMPTGETYDFTSMASSETSSQDIGRVTVKDASGTGNYNGKVVAVAGGASVTLLIEEVTGTNIRGNSLSTSTPTPAVTAYASGDKIIAKWDVPIAGWESGTLQTANTYQVEYASNSDTSDADNTSSFVYGTGGSSVPGALTGSRAKRVRFRSAIQPSDKIEVEVQVNGNAGWFPLGSNQAGSLAYIYNGTSNAGIYTQAVSGSNTDIDVIFVTSPRIGESWSTYSTYKWRVRKVSGGIQGFGNATTNVPGLVTLNQLCPTTEWQEYTPTINNAGVAGDAGHPKGRWRRNGDSMELTIAWLASGAGSGTDTLSADIPSGHTIDTAKTPTSVFSDANVVGFASTYSVGAANYDTLNVFALTATSLAMMERGAGTLITGADIIGNASQFIMRVTIPIKEWAGSLPGLVSDAQVEFAYNDSASTSSDTTSFATGTDGAAIQAFAPTSTNNIAKRVRFANAVTASDHVVLEIYDGVAWIPASDRGAGYKRDTVGDPIYGIRLVGVSSTDFDVQFFSAYDDGTTWATLSGIGWKWRVKKVKSSISALVDNATADSYGLVKGGKVPGATDGVAIAAGYVGEYQENNRSVGINITSATWCSVDSGNVTFNDGNEAGITLTPGEWDIDGYVFFVGDTSTSATEVTAFIGTAEGTTTTALYPDYKNWAVFRGTAAAPVRITLNTPRIRHRVAEGETETIYLKARAVFSGSTLAVYGNLMARRIA